MAARKSKTKKATPKDDDHREVGGSSNVITLKDALKKSIEKRDKKSFAK